MSATMQVTIIAKSGGPLTKRISLAADGSLTSDGSACVMSRGTAKRFAFAGVEQFATLIEHFGPHQAIALGGLRPDLPDEVSVTTKRKLNSAQESGVIARTSDYLVFQPGEPALALVDYDTKGMPPGVDERIEKLGGLLPALVSVLPGLTSAARVQRGSTSAGLYRTDTGEKLAGSSGLHVFVGVRDGLDVERFLKTLHARCWLAGLGWLMVGVGGQLLERSIVDRVVGTPERLVFEGAPVLDPPLAQDETSRRPAVSEGGPLDTLFACPPLTILEQAMLRELRAKEAARLAPDSAKAKKTFIAQQTQYLVDRTGMAWDAATRVIERQCAGILLPEVVLPFDDEDLVGATVAGVLADPTRFEDATLADPIEGVGYGAGKAKIMRRADGTLWINSFAHGRTVFELRFDYRAAENALNKAQPDEAADLFVRLVLAGDLAEDAIERLRNIASRISGAGKRSLDAKLKRARQESGATTAREERERRFAERRDPRPQIPLPPPDAEWLPQMRALNDVLGASRAPEPPMRNVDTFVAELRSKSIPSLHLLTTRGVNPDDTK
jgi:hypothetical protein